MYNQYLDDSDFILLEPEPHGPSPGQHPQGQGRGPSQRQQNHPHPGPGRPQSRPMEPPRSKNDLIGEVTSGLGQLLEGVLKHFSLENFDTGDILLVLIILFLYLESGDNLELVITLGLLLLLGLGDETPKDGESPDS